VINLEALRDRWSSAKAQVVAVRTHSVPFVRAMVFGVLGGIVAFLVLPPPRAEMLRPVSRRVAIAIETPEARIQNQNLHDVIRRCAPTVAPATVLAIMRTESGFRPFALNVNGNHRLQRAPRSEAEAISWSTWLIAQGYSVDMGLMQINSRNLTRLKSTPAEIFDPCQNIRAGATILIEQYGRAAAKHGSGNTALLAAISAYNTGNFRDGFRNGYVSKVIVNVPKQ
jgi:type IV secretion system protein VirB1